jgi:hypothetical protein
MPRRALVLVPIILAGAVLAGCVQTPPETPVATASAGVAAGANALTPGWWSRAVPAGEGHKHADPLQHQNLSTPNFQVLGWDPLVSGSLGTTATGMGCGGTGETKEGRRIAVVHSISSEVAFVVADVTDPAHPKYLGDFYMPNAIVWDATVTPDGLHAIVGADTIALGPLFGRSPILPPVPPAEGAVRIQPQFRDACTGETRAAGPESYVPYGPGLVMVGLQDPTHPALEAWIPQPVIGPHSVSVASIDNVTYVMSSVTNLVHSASYYHFFQVVDTPAGSQLQSLAVIQCPGMPKDPTGNGHIDVELQRHPVTKKLLAYLSNWDTGLEIYDVSDWTMPTQIGHWADGTNGSLHEAHPLPVLWEGKHYTVAGQEIGEPVDRPSSWIYVLDTTDPAHPKEVARWTLPVKVKWDGGLQFSGHYLEVYNRTMFVANYHGGLWAVDLHNVTQPAATGIFVPYLITPKPAKGCPCGPSIEDVVAWPDGTLTTWDNSNGVYTLRFDDAMATLPAPAWSGGEIKT